MPAVVNPTWVEGNYQGMPEIYWPSGNRFELYQGFRFLDNGVGDECYRVTFYSVVSEGPLIDDKHCNDRMTVICEREGCSGERVNYHSF